jgi:tRNA(Ile)-lysidine synthase
MWSAKYTRMKSGWRAQDMLTDESLLTQLQSRDIETLCIAYSGGVDSHALLHYLCTSRHVSKKYAIEAIHVDHGLQAQSAHWARHCQTICQQYGVPYQQINLHCQPPKGASVQAYAREQRYLAMFEKMPPNSCLLTAHHQDDQAETVLLQLLRGAGVRGLAAMPIWQVQGEQAIFRPLLNTVTRQMIMAYAVQHQLDWIDDPSNAKIHYERNYIRHDVIPVLQKHWMSLSKTIARTARLCAETDALLTEIALHDLALCLHADGGLQLMLLKTLSQARRHNVVRYWLAQHDLSMPSEVHMQQIFQQWDESARHKQPKITWHDRQVCRYRDKLYVVERRQQAWQNQSIVWEDLATPLSLPDDVGQLHSTLQAGQGIVLTESDKVTVCFRQGGERCHPQGRVGSHPLKKLLQEWQIPPWQRDKIPLIYVNHQLAQVVGYCLCGSFPAKNAQKGHVITLVCKEN